MKLSATLVLMLSVAAVGCSDELAAVDGPVVLADAEADGKNADSGPGDATQPDAVQPDAVQPDAAQPDAIQPDVSSDTVMPHDAGADTSGDSSAPDAQAHDQSTPDACPPGCTRYSFKCTSSREYYCNKNSNGCLVWIDRGVCNYGCGATMCKRMFRLGTKDVHIPCKRPSGKNWDAANPFGNTEPPDPYLKVMVSSKTVTTAVLKNTCGAVRWQADVIIFDPSVYNSTSFTFEVWDDDASPDTDDLMCSVSTTLPNAGWPQNVMFDGCAVWWQYVK